MAEIFGVVTGALSVAGLFNNAVQCIELIRVGQNLGSDADIYSVRLELAALRLSRWGSAVDINNDARFSVVNSKDAQVHTAKQTLEQLFRLFADAYRKSGAPPTTNLKLLAQLHNPLTNVFREVTKRRMKVDGIKPKVSWAIYRHKDFWNLLENITELLDGLESIFPAQEARTKELAAEEIAEVQNEETLRLLSKISEEIDKKLQEAANQKLEQARTINEVDEANITGGTLVVGDEFKKIEFVELTKGRETINKVRVVTAQQAGVRVGQTFGA
jgi:tRNA U34 5-carboxymethylaminomethyl modifying enzyme MnmG/GidA